jgi:hypothetical protein
MYAIKACAVENTERGYLKKKIIFSLIVKLRSKHLTIIISIPSLSGTATNPYSILVVCNNDQFLWVPGHKGIEGNETANLLAKRGSLHPFIGHEPICGISEESCRVNHQGLDVQRASRILTVYSSPNGA